MSDVFTNTGTLSVTQHSLDALNGTAWKEIASWGDSITAGNGAGAGNQYPTILAGDFDGARTVLNEGKGADTSTDIANRLIAAGDLLGDTQVIWAGRNNVTDPQTVLADIARMVGALGANTHYVILSVLNSDRPKEVKGQLIYDQITGLNAQLAATYAGHYIDVRSLLISHYDPNSAVDVVDHANDVLPTSLRVDDTHPNAAGDAIVAQAVHDFIVSELDTATPRFAITGTGTITTADATLDVTGFDIDGNTLTTTNNAGTTFTVDTTATAMHVVGGAGFDTVIDRATDLTADQRATLFGQGIERIVGASGTWLAPGAHPPPTISGIADDPGRSAIDGVSDRLTNTILGTAVAGSRVSVFSVSGSGTRHLLGTVDAGPDGTWSFDDSVTGGRTTTLVATSAAGNGGADRSSNTFRLLVDTTAPATPSIVALVPADGVSPIDGVTLQTTVLFEGLAENGASVAVYIDGTLAGTTLGKVTTPWGYYNGALAFSAGQHSVAVVAQDVAGNVSSFSDTTAFLIGTAGDDTIVPTARDSMIDGAAGLNTLSFDDPAFASGVTVNLALSTPQQFGSIACAVGGFQDVTGSAGNDRIYGDAGNNVLLGMGGRDALYGSGGNDGLVGGEGDDVLFGGTGTDTVRYAGARGDYAIAMHDRIGTISGPDTGRDRLNSIENVAFADGVLTFDPLSPAAKVDRLFETALGRSPTTDEMSTDVGHLMNGGTLGEAVQGLMATAAYQAIYGATTDEQFIATLLQTADGTAPTSGEQAAWDDVLSHVHSRAVVILDVAQSARERVHTASAVANGLWVAGGTAATAALSAHPDTTLPAM